VQYSLGYVVHNTLPVLIWWRRNSVTRSRPATYWIQNTTSCIAQSKTPGDGQDCCPKHFELNLIYQ